MMDKYADNLTPEQMRQKHHAREMLANIKRQEEVLMQQDSQILYEADFALMMGATQRFLDYTKK